MTARVGQLDIDNDAFPLMANPATTVTRATSVGAGFNWHLNRNVRLSATYDYTDFDADTGTFKGEHEHVVAARVQFGW